MQCDGKENTYGDGSVVAVNSSTDERMRGYIYLLDKATAWNEMYRFIGDELLSQQKELANAERDSEKYLTSTRVDEIRGGVNALMHLKWKAMDMERAIMDVMLHLEG